MYLCSRYACILINFQVMIPLRARTLVVCAGPARYKWKHGIKRDDITAKRVGITLRELSDEFKKGGKSEEVGSAVIETALTFRGMAVGLVDGMAEKQGGVHAVRNKMGDDRTKGSKRVNGIGREQGCTGDASQINTNLSQSQESCNKTSHDTENTQGKDDGASHSEMDSIDKHCDTTCHDSLVSNNDGFQMVSKKKAARWRKVRGGGVHVGEGVVERVSEEDVRMWQEEIKEYSKQVVEVLETGGILLIIGSC